MYNGFYLFLIDGPDIEITFLKIQNSNAACQEQPPSKDAVMIFI